MEMRIGDIRRVSTPPGIAYQVTLEDLVVKLERLSSPRIDRKGRPSPEMCVLIDHCLVLLPGLNTEFVAVGVAYMPITVSAFRLCDDSGTERIDRSTHLCIKVQAVVPFGIAVQVSSCLPERPAVIIGIYPFVCVGQLHADIARCYPHAQERIGDMLGVVRKGFPRFEVSCRFEIGRDLVAEPG